MNSVRLLHCDDLSHRILVRVNLTATFTSYFNLKSIKLWRMWEKLNICTGKSSRSVHNIFLERIKQQNLGSGKIVRTPIMTKSNAGYPHLNL